MKIHHVKATQTVQRKSNAVVGAGVDWTRATPLSSQSASRDANIAIHYLAPTK
jgi:hypothetical protein